MSESEALRRWRELSGQHQAYDGDTIDRPSGEPNWRILGGDTPEMEGSYNLPRNMPGAVPAQEALQQSLDNGAEVEHTGRRGSRGRPLVRVRDDQGDVMGDMVTRGLAVPSDDTLHLQFLGIRDAATGVSRRPEWDQLVSQAERERLDFVRNRFDEMLSRVTHTGNRRITPRENESVGRVAGAAWDRGVDNFQGSLFGFAEVLGSSLGVDAMQDWGEEGMLSNMTQAAQNPARIANYEQAMAGGYEAFGLYVLETLIENAPQFAADIGIALSTGPASLMVAGVGKAALRKFGGSAALDRAGEVAERAFSLSGGLTERPGTIGMGVSMEAQLVGETRRQQYETGLEDETGALAYSWGAGTAKAALEFAGLQTILRSVLRGGDAGSARELAESMREAGTLIGFFDVIRRSAGLGGVAAIGEGTTEMAQSFIDQMAQMGLDPDADVDLGNIDMTELVDSAIRGGIFGGTVGSVGSTVSGVNALRQDRNQHSLDQQASEGLPSSEQTAPEPSADTAAQASAFGKVWLAPDQTDADYTVAREALAQQGEVFERRSQEGATYLTVDPNDPLLDPATPLTGDSFARSKGLTPKSELQGEERLVVEAVDAEGNTLEAAVTDREHLEQTEAAVRARTPSAEVSVHTPESVLERRAQRRAQEQQGLDDLVTEPEALREPFSPEPLQTLQDSPAAQRQAERAAPAPDEERGTAPLYNGDGSLRPTGELIADFRAGRLDRKMLRRVLDGLGIDVRRFASVLRPLDLSRTREAIRQALSRNKPAAARLAGTDRGSVFALADAAVEKLNSADETDLARVAEELDVAPKNAEAVVPGKRKMLQGRVLARLNDEKTPGPIRARAMSTYLPGESSLAEQLAQLSDNDLIGVAEIVGAPTEGVTQSVEPTEADVRGMFQELAERRGKPGHAPRPTPAAPAPRPSGPTPFQQVRESFGWLFGEDGAVKPVETVREELAGADGVEASLRESMTFAQRVFPELGGEVRAAMAEEPADGDTLDGLVRAWQQVLSDTTEPESNSEPEGGDGTRQFLGNAARDFSVLKYLNTALDNMLDLDKLRVAYWEAHWPGQGVALSPEFMEAAESPVDPETTEAMVRTLTRYFYAQFSVPISPDLTVAEQFVADVSEVVADNAGSPERAVIQALSEGFLLGKGATAALQDVANTARRSDGESARARGKSQRASEDDVSFDDMANEQELSDRMFYRAFRQTVARALALADPVMTWEVIQSPPALRELANSEELRFGGTLASLGPHSQNTLALRTTRRAEGKNLLPVVTEFNGNRSTSLVDAVSLALYAKDHSPTNAVEALENLESNLARLVQGPESQAFQDMQPASLVGFGVPGLTKVPDSTVVWMESGSTPVTAGEARSQNRSERQSRSRTVSAATRRDRLSQELDSLNEGIGATLRALKADAAEMKDSEAARLVAEIEAGMVENPMAAARAEARARQKNRRSRLQGLAAEVEAIEQEIEAGGANETLSARLSTAQANYQSARQELDSQPADAPLQDAAEVAQQISRVARMVGFVFPDGSYGSLQNALSRRISIFQELKAVGAEIRRKGASAGVSLRTEEQEYGDAEVAYATDETLAARDRNFDQNMIQRETSAEAEAANHRDEVEGLFYDDRNRDPYSGKELPEQNEIDRALAEAEAREELTPTEARALGWRLAEGDMKLTQIPAEERGLQLAEDRYSYAEGRSAKQPMRPAAKTPGRFSGTQLRGKAAKAEAFKGLAAFTRRMLRVVSVGMSDSAARRRFLATPMAIVQTGDMAALDELARHAGHVATPRGMQSLVARPGYFNLGPVAVISMDPMRANTNPAEWALTFGHELGHLIYDQSWHQLSAADRKAIYQIYRDQTGSQYNGKVAFNGFKEWFADQMSAALAKDVTETRRSKYADADGVLGKVMRFILDRLHRLWQAIQRGDAVRSLNRFKLNLEFEEFAHRILSGKVPLAHRYDAPSRQSMHYTPDTPAPPQREVEQRLNQAAKGELKVSSLFRSVIGRIRSLSPELADSLFQSANRQRNRDGSYEQKRFTLDGRYAALLQRAFAPFGKPGRAQTEAVNAAYTDLREGRETEGAARLRTVIDQMLKDAVAEGWRTGEGVNGFIPHAFDHQALEARRGEVLALARQAMPEATEEELNKQLDRIIDGFGLQELGHEPMGPGKPVGTHFAAQTLIQAIGADRLADMGLLLDQGFGVLHHLAAGLAKRTAWESTFGGFVTRDGSYMPSLQRSAERLRDTGEFIYYDPNIRYKKALEDIENREGVAAAAEVRDLVMGALGHKNLGVKSWVRTSQEWVNGVTSLMILGFSGVASIPELSTAAIRAGFGFNDIVHSLKNYKEAREFVHNLGLAMTSGAEQALRESTGEGYQGSIPTKVTSVFFRLNGQQFITRLSRTVAAAIGMRYIIQSAANGDYASLKKLGLTPEEVQSWDRAGRPAFMPDMEIGNQELARKVSAGIAQFVSEGTLNPNKFQATGWGNNPYLKTVWYLKQFLWTFGDTVLLGVGRSMQEQMAQGRAAGYSSTMSAMMTLAAPMQAMALMMPLALLSLGLRAIMSGDDRFDKDTDELMLELARKTGTFAQWDLLHGLWEAHKRNQGDVGYVETAVNYTGAFVPVVSVSDQIISVSDGKLDIDKSAENLAGMAPLFGQWKGLWQWLFDE